MYKMKYEQFYFVSENAKQFSLTVLNWKLNNLHKKLQIARKEN